MEIRDKKIAFLGDSITFGVGTSSLDKVYWKVVENKTGAICKGYGISGTRIARQVFPSSENDYDKKHFITRVDEIDKNTDIIMVLGGVNDCAHGDAPIGKMSDRRDDTFYGACHLLYTKLIDTFPKAHIFIMTPLHYKDEENQYFNSVGSRRAATLLEYVNIISEVASEYSLAVLDLYRTSGIQPRLISQRELYMPDGIHPNDAGNERIADRIIAFLKGI